MSLKKDLKKLEKSLRTKLNKVRRLFLKLNKSILRYWRRQKATKNDLVLIGTLSAIFLVVLGIIFQILLENIQTNRLLAQAVANPGGGISSDYLASRNPIVAKKPDGLNRPNVAQAAPVELKIKVPILMYHRVNNTLIPGDKYAYGLTVPVANFEAQLNYLKINGYHTVTLADLYDAFYQGKSLPQKPVIITFDDGYIDNYEYAFPLLKKYDETATFFVITNFFGINEYYLTASQIKEMSGGGMDIESHTESHPNLAVLPKKTLDGELKGSKMKIEKLLGKKINFLAYPFGSYSPLVAQESKSAGYLLGVTVLPGNIQSSDNPYGLNRDDIGPRTNLETFARLLY